MNLFRTLTIVSSLLLLSACAGTPRHGAGHEEGCHLKGKTCPLERVERVMEAMPTGYAGQNRHNLVMKPGKIEMSAPERSAAEAASFQQAAPVEVTDSVTVYPLEGDAAFAPVAEEQQVQTVAPTYYGEMVYQTFFLHGSAHLTARERKDIGKVAADINQQPGAVAVTVVGHASQRVDGVTDPIRKKMVNFEIAQKRANAVTVVLHDAGVSPAWVKAVSKGDEESNAAPGARSQEAADRRVEIYLGAQ